MELQQWIQVLRKRWRPIVISTFVLLALFTGLTLSATPVYSSSATLFVATVSDSSRGSAYTDAQFSSQRIATYTQLVDTPQVLEPASKALGFSISKSAVSASSPLNTVIVKVGAKDTDPVRAAYIANAVAIQLSKVIQDLETPVGILATTTVKATVVEHAIPANKPSSPNKKINIALGLIMGLGLGLAIALAMETLDNTVKRMEDVLADTGMNPIGVIGFDEQAAAQPVASLNGRSARSEAFRAIRTNLQFVDVDNPPRVIVVASALPGEGKSTTTLNLAIAFAQAGNKVALIEGDLRKPRLDQYLSIDNSVGLTNVLAEQVSLKDAFVSWNRGLLQVLTSGPLPPNPSELLGSDHMARLIEQLRADFDYVFIDGTPLLLVSDSAALARQTDGALLMTHFGKTTHEQLQRATETLQGVGARLLGPVVNFLPHEGGGYGYGYGYGAGYGDKNSVTVDLMADKEDATVTEQVANKV